MPRSTFSPATLKALVDAITGGPGGFRAGAPPIGIFRTTAKIEGLMRDCGLDFQADGSRVPSLTAYLREAAADPANASKLRRVVLRVAEPDDYDDDPERQRAVVTHLNRFLARDWMQVVLRHDRPHLVELGRFGVVIGAAAAKAGTIDFDAVQLDIERALASAEDDPEDAVAAACSTIESVCRSILTELKLPLPARRDIDGLVRAVQEPLGLSPARSDLPAEIAADVRQVLSGLTTTAKGIGALRAHAGDAHGRERGSKRIDGRIARLAIHGASTLALFLIETWELRQQRPLPHATEGKAA